MSPIPSSNFRRKLLSPALALVLLGASCHASLPQVSAAPPSPTDFCAELHGEWDTAKSTCGLTVRGDRTTTKITEQYPVDLVDDPVSGPVLKAYLRGITDKFSHPATSPLVHDGSANIYSTTYTHAPRTTSVVFRENWFLPGAPHPSEGITTFTFDLDQGKQLSLADLFCPGVDPLKALPPLIRPYVQQALDAAPGALAPMFTIERFEPSDQPGSLASDYRAWALDGDDLVLYMPVEGSTGGIPAGLVSPRVPLSSLHEILRDGSCSA
ncbi:hypothetical protein [Segniliparus rotundus]|uniref:hypothetical protein n=1 Tax=Segniliparus rotundus TaxID=286802 RepID=UPI0002FFB79E|nr:hypothetical protein [Segniliparus rotundus]